MLLVKTGQPKTMLIAINARVYSSQISIGLMRNLNEAFTSINPKIEVSLRLFDDADLHMMNEKFRHIGFIKRKIPDCYTGITKDNHPCFRMWFMKSSQNEQIKNYFGDLFPTLKHDEALIEGVFTNPKYRGLKIMPYVINKISEQSNSEGINKVIAFVKTNNIPSLRGFRQSGFAPYLIRKEKWVFFNRTVTFEPLNDTILKEYEQNIKENNSLIPMML